MPKQRTYMKEIEINNVPMRLMTTNELKNHNWLSSWHDFSCGLSCVSYLDKEDIAIMVGLNTEKMDFSLPHNWAVQQPDDTVLWTVWYYGYEWSRLFGEPVDLRARLHDLEWLIKERYEQAGELIWSVKQTSVAN